MVFGQDAPLQLEFGDAAPSLTKSMSRVPPFRV